MSHFSHRQPDVIRWKFDHIDVIARDRIQKRETCLGRDELVVRPDYVRYWRIDICDIDSCSVDGQPLGQEFVLPIQIDEELPIQRAGDVDAVESPSEPSPVSRRYSDDPSK